MMEKQPKKWCPRGMTDLMNRQAHSDVLGSYTGIPMDPEDPMPVQDADDL